MGVLGYGFGPMKDARQTVIAAAKALSFLDGQGRLVEIDSLGIVDLVLEIETRLGRRIPLAELDQSVFKSIESIVEMIKALPPPK